jgi:hypothetical protein
MRLTPDELAKRFAEADRMVVLLRRATLDMQAVRRHVLGERQREPRRPGRDGARLTPSTARGGSAS